MEQTVRGDQLISFHRNLYDYVQSPQNSLQLAFGDLQYKKFTKELLESDDILKIKVLTELNEAYSLSNNINLSLLSSDLLQILLQHFQNENNLIRELSSRAIRQISKIYLGKDELFANQALEKISKLLDDNIEKIRQNSYNALLNYSNTQQGKDRILQTTVMQQLITKLKDEEVTTLLIKDLQLILSLLEGEKAINQTLSTAAITNLLDLLSHDSDLVKQLSINNLTAISNSQMGKSSIIFKNGVIKVSPFITSPCVPVVQAATICLCSLAQVNQAKDQIIDQGEQYFNDIVQLLSHKNTQIVTNTVQLLGNISQHKVGRQLAQSTLAKLKSLKDIDQNYLQSTIDIIEWRP